MSQTVTGDFMGRLSSIANILGTFTNSYQGNTDRLAQITHSGVNAGFNSTFTYHGEALDHASASITSFRPGAQIVGKHTYGYDDLGRIETWKREAPLANPIPATNPTRQFESSAYYDLSDQLKSFISKALPGSTVAQTAHHFSHDPAGNILSKQVETSGSTATMRTFSYNNLNQLSGGGAGGALPVTVRGQTNEAATVKAKRNSDPDWKNARQLSNNRFEADLTLANGSNQLDIQATDGSANQSNYAYSLNLAAQAVAAPTYDADGNMLNDGTRSYTWDRQSRLVKITWGGSPLKTTEFRYNALGQRSERIEKSGTTTTAQYYFIFDGIEAICRFQGGTTTANLDRQYLAQGERRKNGSTWTSYYHTHDHLGSIREVLAADGTLKARYDYDPFGTRRIQYEAPGFISYQRGFTGHQTLLSPIANQSEIVLTYFRVYNPNLGKWLSADPLGESDGNNLYQYVSNDPINLLDPDGMWGIQFGGVNLGVGNPSLQFSGESWGHLANGAMATADGFIPFSDPFSDFGAYDGCDDDLSISKKAGKVAYVFVAAGAIAGQFATSSGYVWSGVSAEVAASEAAAIGARTLGMTNGGRVAAALDGILSKVVLRGVKVFPWGARKWIIWAPSSALYAATMERLGGSNLQKIGDIYKYVEKPILKMCGKL